MGNMTIVNNTPSGMAPGSRPSAGVTTPPTLTDNGAETVGEGAGIPVVVEQARWGHIEGDIRDQTDLQQDLDTKAEDLDLVRHVNDTSNPHHVSKAQAGLSEADNTSDAQKPVSGPQKAYIDAAVTASVATLSVQPTFRNLIDNANFNVAQQYGAVPTSADFFIDRWRVYNNNTVRLTGQSAPTSGVAGSSNKLLLGVANSGAPVAGDFYGVVQSLENLTTASLRWGTQLAVPVTLSFKAAGPAGNYSVLLRNNNVDARNYVIGYTLAATDVLQSFKFTIPGDTVGPWAGWNGGVSVSDLQILFGVAIDPARLVSTPNQWLASGIPLGVTGQIQFTALPNGTLWQLWQVQLEAGTGASAFEVLPYSVDLSRCQRFFEVLGQGVGSEVYNVGFMRDTTGYYAPINYLEKRIVPGIVFSPGIANFQVLSAAGAIVPTSLTTAGQPANTKMTFLVARFTGPTTPGWGAMFQAVPAGGAKIFVDAQI